MCIFSNNFLYIYHLILFKRCKSPTPESMFFLVQKLTQPSLLFVFKEDLRKSHSYNASTVPQRSHFFSLVWCYEVSKSECVPCHMSLKFYYHLDQRQQQQQHWTQPINNTNNVCIRPLSLMVKNLGSRTTLRKEYQPVPQMNYWK